IVSAEEEGLRLDSFHSAVIPASSDQITWHIGESGFDMHLSGQVPASIAEALPHTLPHLLDGCTRADIRHWAIHPGGRSVLDAVQQGAGLQAQDLHHSREVLRSCGNMSSATVMLLLRRLLQSGHPAPGGATA